MASSHHKGTKAQRGPDIRYGWPRLLLCYLAPPLLARATGARGRRYVEAFLWLDLACLAANVLVDRGPVEGLRRLPEDAGVWPPRRRRHRALSWAALAGTAAVTTLATLRLPPLLDRGARRRGVRLLSWTPLDVGWSPPSGLSRDRLLYLIPLAVLAEECYIRGLLWSRMAWLRRWRPLVSGTAWAFYHLNQPLKNVIGSILPGALLASYTRDFTGNVYRTAIGHFLSNSDGAWSAGRQQYSPAATPIARTAVRPGTSARNPAPGR